jgi:hypothetical protein
MTLCRPQGEPGEEGAEPYNLNDFFGAWPDNDNPLPASFSTTEGLTKPQGTSPSHSTRRSHPEGIGRV